MASRHSSGLTRQAVRWHSTVLKYLLMLFALPVIVLGTLGRDTAPFTLAVFASAAIGLIIGVMLYSQFFASGFMFWKFGHS